MSVKLIPRILFMRYFVFDQFNSCLQDKEEQLDEGEKSITVDECLIDIIKGTKVFSDFEFQLFAHVFCPQNLFRNEHNCQAGASKGEVQKEFESRIENLANNF